MNCKARDMAVVVHGDNIGLIVEIVGVKTRSRAVRSGANLTGGRTRPLNETDAAIGQILTDEVGGKLLRRARGSQTQQERTAAEWAVRS